MAPNPAAPRAVIPRATYRLQLHKDFDFEAATRVLPYLARLGVSHVYCSPISRARPGSQHGYDVVDHREINPELGGREGFDRFAAAAREHGLGLVLDLVPNHMGVIGADNPWWSDVLENGPASPYAGYFDINWRPFNRQLEGKVLVPVLGEPYGDVLDQGQFSVVFEPAAGQFALRYFEHRFPLDPQTWGTLLQAAAGHCRDGTAQAALASLANAVTGLPGRDAADAQVPRDRAKALAPVKRQLADLVADDAPAAAEAQAAIERAAADFNGAERHDELHALLEAQAYRLAFWHVAADEINYRRFFDVNELAALRMEDPKVFEDTHGMVLDLTAAGVVDGLRIDHPDGLRDPARYFERLQQGHASRVARLQSTEVPPSTPSDAPALYVVAEKITAAHGDQPGDWQLHGTTGYRFGMLVNGLFVDRRQADRFERLWRDFSGVTLPYEDMVFESKRAVATGALSSELTELATQLKRIADAHRGTRDFGFNTLRDALADVAACMPVYRTYVVEQASAQDRRFIDWAIAQARRRSGVADPTVFDFMRRCLLAETAPGSDEALLAPVRQFAWRFQQFCAPVAAKGVEDTAFYRYHRLVSLNEVGGDPASFGVTVAAFHGASVSRLAHWPHTMLATSTHDNKRSEDVRNRIDVLSEMPAVWRLGLRRWRLQTRSHRREINGTAAPSAADEWLLYQILLGSLPVESELDGELDVAGLAAYRERVEQYMLKAARESKQQTSWMRPDPGYEEALLGFIRGVLGRLGPNPVLADLRERAEEIAWFGGLNSLSMALLKFTSPGVPDLYQGNELIDLSLVDPDNRRPVDYALRTRLLDELAPLVDAPDRAVRLAQLAARPADGRIKLWATWQLLLLRRQDPTLFESGEYLPLRVTGSARDHVVAFARRTHRTLMIVVAGRLFAKVLRQPHQHSVPATAWGDTRIELGPLFTPKAGQIPAREILTNTVHHFNGGPVRVADAFAALPGAVFVIDLKPGLRNG